MKNIQGTLMNRIQCVTLIRLSKGCNVIFSVKKFSLRAVVFALFLLCSLNSFSSVYYIEVDHDLTEQEIMDSLAKGFKVELYEQINTSALKRIYKIESIKKASISKQIPAQTVKDVTKALNL